MGKNVSTQDGNSSPHLRRHYRKRGKQKKNSKKYFKNTCRGLQSTFHYFAVLRMFERQ